MKSDQKTPLRHHNSMRESAPRLGVADDAKLTEALRGSATRREVMGWLMASGMTATVAGTIIGGASNALAQTPKKGGQLRVAGFSSSTKDTLDPAKGSFSTDYARGFMFYNALARLDESLTAQPELAESWDANANATEWVFRLRKEVTFHDGKKLNSEDVVYSILRHKDPKVASAAKTLADAVQEVKADGPNLVRVKLAGSNPDLPVLLGTYNFLIIKNGTADFSTAVGTGPYSVKEFKPGVRSVALRNPNYWKSDKPHVEEIEFFGIQDDAARLNALLAGDVHLMGQLDPTAIPRLESTPGYALFETKSGQFSELVMMEDRAPSNNADLCAAFKYLFDRPRLVKTLLRGRGVVANDQPIDPTNPFYCADIAQRVQDFDKAKFHLKKAGMENATIPIYASNAAVRSIEMAVLLQQAAQQVGLKIEIQRQPADAYWSNTWMKRAFHFAVWNPRPTADIILTLAFKSDAEWNESRWKSPEFDDLLLKARSELNDEKRKNMYCRMQQLIRDDAGRAIVCFISFLDGYSSKLKGLRAIPLGNFGGGQFAEDVWLDS
jgi:peptide/nickel transport system substrate-binding protein